MHAGSRSPESKPTTARPKWLIPLGWALALYYAQQAFDLARHYNLPQLARPTELQLRDYRKLAGKD